MSGGRCSTTRRCSCSAASPPEPTTLAYAAIACPARYEERMRPCRPPRPEVSRYARTRTCRDPNDTMSGMEVRIRNNVVVTGQPGAPIVMLAHGFGCDQHMWRLVAAALAEEFRVVTFDWSAPGARTCRRGVRSATRRWTATREDVVESAGSWTCVTWCSSGTRSAP